MSWSQDRFGLSERRACGLIGLARSCCRYRSRKPDQRALGLRLRDLAAARPRYGYRRLHVLLRREGWAVNAKRVYRIYRELGLLVRTKRRRKTACQSRLELPEATQPNERWSLDFLADSLHDGRRFRVLAVLDQFSRECVALYASGSIPASAVTEVLDRAIAERGATPDSLRIDNGTEFTSRHFDAWAWAQGLTLDFIRPGRPVENAHIESFNGRLRDECLNQSWFTSLTDARRALAAWQRDYNESRPHSSLGGLAPNEFVASLLTWAGH